MHNLITRMRHKETGKIIGQGLITDFRDSPDWVFEHHIGWRDKNGTMVFVGDVCLADNGRLAKVVWDVERMGYDFIMENTEGGVMPFTCPILFEERVEVIGSYYKEDRWKFF